MRPVVVVNALLLAAIAAAIGLWQVGLDREVEEVELSVRRYAAAVTRQQLAGAVAEIAPDARAAWSDWIAGQLGNVYEVQAVSVRVPSPLTRIVLQTPDGPTEATVFMDVNRGFPGEYYQATERVPVVQVNGRWYVREPLLAPEE